jgi:glycosyltransferase involved in cell wall biosynthesis
VKILLLNYTDSGGGAAIAAYRLLTALKAHGVDATLGVVEKKTADSSVIFLQKKSICKKINLVFWVFIKLFNKSVPYFIRLYNIRFKTLNPIIHSQSKKTAIDINYINNSDFDLVHLHWINADTVSIEDIAKIKKPIVWTMHDSWVFCGAEHHPDILENDTRYITGYTKKNKPQTTRGPDICRKVWERKKRAWKNCQFGFVSPSNFESMALCESALFRNVECTIIPNIVPEMIFKPFDKKILRALYNIPVEKNVIGFYAADVIIGKKSIKGSDLLFAALQKISKYDSYHLVVFGNIDDSFCKTIPFPVFSAGNITNPYILAGIYNLCDVFVCPSIIENLPNVCLEALFCGVPVAAFQTGGIPDIVEHKKTGYLATPFDVDDLYRGILYCMDNNDILSKNSIHKAYAEFNNESIAKKHTELYRKILYKN